MNMETDDSNLVNKESPALFEDISPTKNDGILKTIVKPGKSDEGKASSGCKVYVHYVGRLENGEKFDSSRDRGEVFTFQLGNNAVIKGWDIGVATMNKGEICELKIAPEYGYGDAGFPPKIPEKSNLIFEIELLGWDDENITDDNLVRKKILKEGDSLNKPNKDAVVKVHLRGSYEGRLFDERDVEFTIGDGYEHNIVDGVELAICKMKRHEKARVYIHASYGFKVEGYEKFDIPPNASSDIVYEICLFSFEKAKEIYEMDFEEKLERSRVLKERALKCIQASQYFKAIDFYERIIQFVNINEQDADYPKGLLFKIAANSNSALCYLKLKDFLKAKKSSEKVLRLDPNHVKAYYRLGEALVGLQEYKKAICEFENALKLEPTNAAAKMAVNNTRVLLKKQINDEKRLYGNIFAKISES